MKEKDTNYEIASVTADGNTYVLANTKLENNTIWPTDESFDTTLKLSSIS